MEGYASMWRSLVAWVLVVGLAWSAWLGADQLYAWEYSVGHFAFARVGAPALHFVLGGLGVALDVVAVLALLLPRPRGFGVVLGALIFGLATPRPASGCISRWNPPADRDTDSVRFPQGGVAKRA